MKPDELAARFEEMMVNAERSPGLYEGIAEWFALASFIDELISLAQEQDTNT